MGRRELEFPVFTNAAGLPDELVPVIERTLVCEFASIKRDGTPVTTALAPTPGPDGRTIDVNTGLAYPSKAERARRNPKVCLSYSEPAALPGDGSPVVLVYGHATVHDADLQLNTDRYVAVSLATSPSFHRLPGFALKAMRGYLARIWIAVTPLKLLWWPAGDMTGSPQSWVAPDGTTAPISDPAPQGGGAAHRPLVSMGGDWRVTLEHALRALGQPILTAIDSDGYPVPLRVATGRLQDGAVRLELLGQSPDRRDGTACLSFHTLKVKNGEMAANENRTYLGSVTFADNGAEFAVEYELPTVSFRPGLRGNLALIALMRKMRARLEDEATRRGQPVPEIRLPGRNRGAAYADVHAEHEH